MLPHRRRVAAPVEGFVAYGIGRSIWEDTIAAHRRGELNNASTVTVISQEYLRYADRYRSQRPLVAWVASTDHGSDRIGTGRRAGTMRRPGWSTRSGRRHAPGRCGVRALPRVAPRGQAQAAERSGKVSARPLANIAWVGGTSWPWPTESGAPPIAARRTIIRPHRRAGGGFHPRAAAW